MAFTRALYYPWIDIRYDGWIKSASLYWDTIQTIVPQSISCPYSGDVAQAFEDEGILQPLRVRSDMVEIEDLTEDVLKFLNSPEAANIFLHTDTQRYAHIHPEKLPETVRRLSSIHPEKLPNRVRDIIENIGLGRENKGWLEVDESFADFYMTLLATKLSERLGIALLTENASPHRLSLSARTDSGLSTVVQESDRYEGWYGYRGRRQNIPRELTQGMMVDLIVEKIGLDRDTPIEKILEFRKIHKSEIGRFRKQVEELTKDIPDELEIDALRQHLKDKYVNEVEPAIEDLKRALSGSRIKWLTNSWMRVSFLSAGSSSVLVGMGLDVPNALLVGAGISLVGMGVLFNEEKRDIIRGNPYAYILAMEREQWI
ncbi:MAG TPA: DUF6236 family protein [Candidatus Aquicultor sp.]